MPRQKLKRLIAGALCGAMLLALPACQEDPEGSIVANKDMDKLISQGAESGGESRVDAGELIEDAKKTETYKTTLDSPNLKVKAEVDAQVELPEVEKLSIYRVKQKPFTQEFLDKVRAELCGDVELFDGKALSVRTKKDIEREINFLRQSVEDYTAQERQLLKDPNLPEEHRPTEEEVNASIEEYRQMTQSDIDERQQEYEAAPDEVNFADYPTDYKIHLYRELYESDPESYESGLTLHDEEGDAIFDAASDGSDGHYRMLVVQNNADYSNKIAYSDNLGFYKHMSGVMVEDTMLDYTLTPRELGLTQDYEGFWKEKGVPSPVITNNYVLEEGFTFKPIDKTEISFTQEEAQAKAEELLGRLGLTDFKFSQGGKYSELLSGEDEEADFLYDVLYVLRYTRELEGVQLTQSSGAKFVIGQDTSNPNRKQMWPGESIEIRINDRGIVGFQYNAPLEITETVVEGTSLKTFDEVKGTFEQMLPMLLAEEDFEVTAKVDRVRLSYSRISEKDSFDTGLVVPVWSFEGETQAYFNGYPMYDRKGTLMAINAIDGSVIDADLGY